MFDTSDLETFDQLEAKCSSEIRASASQSPPQTRSSSSCIVNITVRRQICQQNLKKPHRSLI